MQINEVPPVFGETYGLGWLGFVRSAGDVSDAIAYGERSERAQDMPQVTHVLIVTGDGICVEARMDVGVVFSRLGQYFDDPTCKIYFRKPAGMDEISEHAIVVGAQSKVNCHYANILIAEQAMADSLVGHLINKAFDDLPHEELSKLFTEHGAFICSMLGAFCLGCARQYEGRDVLARPITAIDPQMLFQSILFEPFVNDCSKKW